MAVVVSDTSPVRCLVHLGRLDILPALFGEVLVPPGVVHELRTPAGAFDALDVGNFAELRIVAPRDLARVQQFRHTLDRGESEALALALEVQAEVILIDEAAGRVAAEQVGLIAVGVIGVLIRAKRQQLISEIKPLLDQMIDELNFYVERTPRAIPATCR